MLLGFESGDTRLVEPISVQAVGRASLETYLTFHYIFIDPDSDGESYFRYYAWLLETLIRRQEKYDITKFEHLAEVSEKGRKEIEHARSIVDALSRQQTEVRDAMKDTDYYKSVIASGNKQDIQQCNQRIEHGWFPKRFDKLIRRAGLNFLDDREAYGWLSAAAHPSFSVMEACRKATTYEEQRDYSQFSKSISMIALARMCLEYRIVFPNCKGVFDSCKFEAALAKEICKHQSVDD